MDFPRFVYAKGSTDGQLVHDETEHSAALKAGYFPSIPETMAGKLGAPIKVKAPEIHSEKPAEPLTVGADVPTDTKKARIQ
jgi:hypothetical protein